MKKPIVPWAWQTFTLPGVGTLIQHRAWWWPQRTLDVWFKAEGSTVTHEVPGPAVDDLLAAKTVEQAMAAIRNAGR